MKKTLLSAVLALTCIAVSAQTESSVREKLQKHLGYLASDNLYGREAGSACARLAATYIAEEFAHMGLKPYGDSTYYAYFDKGAALGVGDTYCDVIGVLEGNDPVLKDEIVIIGAHYDHLGSRDGEIYNGADDNASGTSALIEVARDLASHRDELKRTVIFAAFDAEELGLYGSMALAKSVMPAEVVRSRNHLDIQRTRKVCLMISADMIGWLKVNGKLEVEGVNTLQNGKEILCGIAERHGIELDPKSFENSLVTATDTRYFAMFQVPTLAVSTGLKSPYHKPEDDVAFIDFDGLEKITGYLADVVMTAATDKDMPVASGHVAKIHRSKEVFEFGVAAGIGSTAATYPKASAINGKSSLSGSLGVAAQLNLGNHLAIRPEAYFEAASLLLPEQAQESYFSERDRYHYGRVMAPVSLIVKAGSSKDGDLSAYLYCGGGVNWSKDIYTQMTAQGIKNSADPFGWHWIFGMNLKKAAFEVLCTCPIGKLDYVECEPFGASSCTSQFRLIRWF